MFFKKRENGFKDIKLAMLGVGFLIIVGTVPANFYKGLMVFLIPLLTSPLIFKRMNIKNIEEFKKNIKIILFIFSFEVLIISQLFFLGMPEIPYLIAPLNNLLFWGMTVTIMCTTLLKKGKYNKKIIKIILIGCWIFIFLYQFRQKFDTIKGMW